METTVARAEAPPRRLTDKRGGLHKGCGPTFDGQARGVMRHVSLALVFVLAACSDKAPTPTVVPAEPAAAAAPSVAVVPAVRAIYEGFAAAPSTFDRLPHLSRFYVEDNQRVDAACAAGEARPRCNGDRFACLPTILNKPGAVVDVIAAGEQAGVSASTRVTLKFGDVTTTADVDVVVEDGRWKIDQVRCN